MTLRQGAFSATPVRLPVRMVWSCMALWLVAVCLLGPAVARANVLEVRGVSVDITADSAAAAREQAIVEAQREAFGRLVSELTGGASAPGVDDDQIATLVRDFSIVSEKTSAVRYIATFDFRFDEDGVREVLRRHDAPMVPQAEPVVVVPVYEHGGSLALWDDPNPWRQAWTARPPSGGPVPTMVPPGDLTDVATIGPEQAVGGDLDSLTELTQQYGAGGALVAHAALDDAAAGQPSVTVTSTRYDRSGEQDRFAQTFRSNANETVESLLERAVAGVDDALQTRWRQANAAGDGPRRILAVSVPVTGLSDWLSLRRRLTSQPMVGEADVVAMSPQEVQLDLHYQGEIEALTAALRRDGLALDRDGPNWILRAAGAVGR